MRTAPALSYRQFIEWVSATSTLCQFVRSQTTATELNDENNNQPTSNLLTTYQQCITQLTAFRTDHVKIVTQFIVAPKAKQSQQYLFKNVSAVGTGGTDFMVFLKQCRDDTKLNGLHT